MRASSSESTSTSLTPLQVQSPHLNSADGTWGGRGTHHHYMLSIHELSVFPHDPLCSFSHVFSSNDFVQGHIGFSTKVSVAFRLLCSSSPCKHFNRPCWVLCSFARESLGFVHESESEVAQSCPTLATPWTVAHQASPSMGFSRQEYWSGFPFTYSCLNLPPIT